MSTFCERVLASVSDDRERELLRELLALSDQCDAASDGALHHAYPADVADRMVRDLEYRYGRALAALSDYRDAHGATIEPL